MTYPFPTIARPAWPARWEPPGHASRVELVVAALVDTSPRRDNALAELAERAGAVYRRSGVNPAADPTVIEFLRQVAAAQVLLWELWTLQRAGIAPGELFASRETISEVRAVVLADIEAADSSGGYQLHTLARASAAALFGTDIHTRAAIGRSISINRPLLDECAEPAAALTGPWSVAAALAPDAVGKRYHRLNYPTPDRPYDLAAALGIPGQIVDLAGALAQAEQRVADAMADMVRTRGFDVGQVPLNGLDQAADRDRLAQYGEAERTLFSNIVLSQVAADDHWRIDGRIVGSEVASSLLMQRALTALGRGDASRAALMFPPGDLIHQDITRLGMPLTFTTDFVDGAAEPPNDYAADFPVVALQRSPDGVVRWWGIENTELSELRADCDDLRRRLEGPGDLVGQTATTRLAIAQTQARLALGEARLDLDRMLQRLDGVPGLAQAWRDGLVRTLAQAEPASPSTTGAERDTSDIIAAAVLAAVPDALPDTEPPVASPGSHELGVRGDPARNPDVLRARTRALVNRIGAGAEMPGPAPLGGTGPANSDRTTHRVADADPASAHEPFLDLD